MLPPILIPFERRRGRRRRRVPVVVQVVGRRGRRRVVRVVPPLLLEHAEAEQAGEQQRDQPAHREDRKSVV